MDLRCLAVPLGPTLTSVDLGHSSIEASWHHGLYTQIAPCGIRLHLGGARSACSFMVWCAHKRHWIPSVNVVSDVYRTCSWRSWPHSLHPYARCCSTTATAYRPRASSSSYVLSSRGCRIYQLPCAVFRRASCICTSHRWAASGTFTHSNLLDGCAGARVPRVADVAEPGALQARELGQPAVDGGDPGPRGCQAPTAQVPRRLQLRTGRPFIHRVSSVKSRRRIDRSAERQWCRNNLANQAESFAHIPPPAAAMP